MRKWDSVEDSASGRTPILLRPPVFSDEEQARQAQEELALENFEFLFDLQPGTDWALYLARLEQGRLGIELPVDRVTATFLLAEAEGQVVGRLSIRHELNDYLAQFGGHIGYAVRPGFRRRGYATAILRQSLVIASGLGLERVLVTCDADNLGSAKVIESCGGALENVVLGDGSVPKSRYWVEVAS
jgi:predicted acetyltransferase